MKPDLIFSRKGVTFQFRLLDNGNIKWRGYEEGQNPNESTQHHFFMSLYTTPEEKRRALALDLESYGRFTGHDRNKVIKWFAA